jgi:Cof subfamily protein (haloacid dehalogenase superfamily)
MIRLVFVDVDGTLVGSSATVLPEVWRAVERARACGIRLALCSGRPAFGITREYARRLDADGWHVFQNGASVINLASGRSLSAYIASEIVVSLIARARTAARLLELYADDDYAVERTDHRARDHAMLLGVPFRPRPLESLSRPVVRALWLISHSDVDAVIAEPHEGLEISSSTSPVMPDTQFVNMTHEGVDKASAVRAVAEEYAVPLEEVMFVGDGRNDAVAMRVVGFPVAMANADPEARAAARLTVGHVDEAGLADALEMATGT